MTLRSTLLATQSTITSRLPFRARRSNPRRQPARAHALPRQHLSPNGVAATADLARFATCQLLGSSWSRRLACGPVGDGLHRGGGGAASPALVRSSIVFSACLQNVCRRPTSSSQGAGPRDRFFLLSIFFMTPPSRCVPFGLRTTTTGSREDGRAGAPDRQWCGAPSAWRRQLVDTRGWCAPPPQVRWPAAPRVVLVSVANIAGRHLGGDPSVCRRCCLRRWVAWSPTAIWLAKADKTRLCHTGPRLRSAAAAGLLDVAPAGGRSHWLSPACARLSSVSRVPRLAVGHTHVGAPMVGRRWACVCD